MTLSWQSLSSGRTTGTDLGRVREGEGSRARKEGAGGGAPGGEERSGEGALEGVLEAVPEAVPWLCTLTWGEGLARGGVQEEEGGGEGEVGLPPITEAAGSGRGEGEEGLLLITEAAGLLPQEGAEGGEGTSITPQGRGRGGGGIHPLLYLQVVWQTAKTSLKVFRCSIVLCFRSGTLL